MARKIMQANPESRQAEGKDAPAKSDITMPLKPTTTLNTSPEARVEDGYDVVSKVNRTMPAGCPEEARKKNNAARDARTNLGRTIPSVPTI